MTNTYKPRVVVLTGAGVSAESGLKTFRDNNGLWENHRVEDVATPEGSPGGPTPPWVQLVTTWLDSLPTLVGPCCEDLAIPCRALGELVRAGNRLYAGPSNVHSRHERCRRGESQLRRRPRPR